MRSELLRLKRDTDSSRQIPALSSDSAVSFPAALSAGQSGSTSAVVAVAKQHKLGIGISSLIAVLLIGAAGYGIYVLFSHSRPAPFQNFTARRATVTGKARLVAISPDGKYLLHVVDDGGQQSLWLQNIPTKSNTQVVEPAQAEYQGLRFSPDGNYLYFSRSEPGSRSLKYCTALQCWAELHRNW